MSAYIYSHPEIFLHDQEAHHQAMSSDRIQLIYDQVAQTPGVELKDAPLADRADFLLAHDPQLVSQIFDNAPRKPGSMYAIDSETSMTWRTLSALRRSSGAALAGIEDLVAGRASSVFCVAYAGHHAAPKKAGGFCFFNPVAIAAAKALELGLSRVAILDFDTHSGNGTILTFIHEPRVFFAETYQPGYPGSFMPGFCPPQIHRTRCKGGIDFWRAWERHFKAMDDFSPELIILSAGFDAHASDPLGTLRLGDADYDRFAREIKSRKIPVLAYLEGGYNVETTARCAALFATRLAE